MYDSQITLYCVRYDPYLCDCDPETLWGFIQGAGGGVHAGVLGQLDFYVPERLIALVLLRDSGLRVIESKSYI